MNFPTVRNKRLISSGRWCTLQSFIALCKSYTIMMKNVDELFLGHGWRSKGIVTDPYHRESDFRLFWMNFCSSNNLHTTAPLGDQGEIPVEHYLQQINKGRNVTIYILLTFSESWFEPVDCYSGILYWSSFDRRIPCSTVSKDFWRSANMPQKISLHQGLVVLLVHEQWKRFV